MRAFLAERAGTVSAPEIAATLMNTALGFDTGLPAACEGGYLRTMDPLPVPTAVTA